MTTDGDRQKSPADGPRLQFDNAFGQFWVDTPNTVNATNTLFQLLKLSRKLGPWLPPVVLTGPEGSGRVAIAERFAHLAQRSVSCDLMTEVERLGRAPRIAPPGVTSQGDDDHQAWTDEMFERAQHFGACPRVCSPASFISQNEIDRILLEVAETAPVGIGSVPPDLRGSPMFPALRSRGNETGHVTRRTTMLFIADADRLLGLTEKPLIRWLTEATHISWFKWRIMFVIIGSYRVRDMMVGVGGANHVIDLGSMPLDDLWHELVEKILGPTSRMDAEMLHHGCGGTVGKLLYVAQMRDLEPPYHVNDGEIRRLPS